jgi:RNA polymerase sigma factor (sigma-70 family)
LKSKLVKLIFVKVYFYSPKILMSEKHIVELIKSNHDPTIQSVYLKNKLPFFKIANGYKIPNEVALDIYQDSIVALIENVRKGKVDDLKSSINTYLLAIGKFMIFKYLKSKKHVDLDSVKIENIEGLDAFSVENESLNLRELMLKKAYESLGEQCKKILNLFYFENKKLDDIQAILNYENKDVLKSQKSRCISHLKKIIKEK